MTNGYRKNNTKNLTTGAVLSAISVVFVILAGVIPGIKLSLLALASFPAALMVLRTGPRGGLAVYAVSSLLALLLSPFKLTAVLYIIFFGYYATAKYIIESRLAVRTQRLAKLLLFAAVALISYFFLSELFLGGSGIAASVLSRADMGSFLSFLTVEKITAPIFVIGAVIILFIYDAIFSGVITFFFEKIDRYTL